MSAPASTTRIALGFSVYEVAPATLVATFLTSIAGIATYQVLALSNSGAAAPEWVLGAFLGVGGFAGAYCGALAEPTAGALAATPARLRGLPRRGSLSTDRDHRTAARQPAAHHAPA